MKKSVFPLFFSLLLFSGYTVKSQQFALGVRGGISIPNLTAGSNNQNPLNTGYGSRLGPDAGIFAEVKFSDLFSLQPMVEYSSQGGKKNGLQAITTPSEIAGMYPPGQAPLYLYANYKSEAKLNYLIVPLLAKFGWDFNSSPWRIYVDAGPFVGLLLSAKQVTSGNSPFYTDPAGQQALPGGSHSFDNTQNIKDELHRANVGVEGNLGLSYRFGPNSVFIEGGGNYGFRNIQKASQNGKNNTGAVTAVIGYSYWFGN